MQYHVHVMGPDDMHDEWQKKRRARITCKHKATHTEMGVPPECEGFRKTTRARRFDSKTWQPLEKRVHAWQKAPVVQGEYN